MSYAWLTVEAKYYKSTDKPNPYNKELTSREIWECDLLKQQAATDNGFNILYVWESDYYEKKDEIIENCLYLYDN